MPKILDIETQSQILTASGSRFVFSHIRPDKLTATEYTLVTIVIDNTGSVEPFSQQLLDMLMAAVESCQQSLRAEYLLVRVTTFNTVVTEMHGFRPLADIDLKDYKLFRPDGQTALYDATINAIAAATAYAETLRSGGVSVNLITFIITDGADNVSKARPGDIVAELQRGRLAEALDSHLTVLIGVNAKLARAYLENFQREAQLDGYVDVADASPHKLAQLAAFISASIGQQSQILGTGGKSQILPFPK